MFRSMLLIPLLLLLSACERSETPPPVIPDQVGESSISDTAIATSGPFDVEIQQGTNMSAAVSPDGTQIVFSIQGTLFTMNVEGGEARAITDYYFDARGPSWSRDGRSIVFHGYRNGNWDIWRIDSDGNNPQAMTDNAFDDREPAYSPLNDDIVFSSDRSGNYDLWILENGTARQLTGEVENAHSPSWSPDGASIAYAVDAGNRTSEIRTLELAGGEAETELVEAGAISGLAWRPDGSALSYQIRSDNPETGTHAELKLLGLDTDLNEVLSAGNADVFPFRASWTAANTLVYTASGEIRQLIIDESETVIPFVASFRLDREPYQRRSRNYDSNEQQALGISAPAISNDGNLVVFSALADLWLMEVSSGELTQITDDAFAERHPVFSVDGNQVAYSTDSGGTHVVWIYDIAREQAEKLEGDISLSYMKWSPDGERLAGFRSGGGAGLSGRITVVDIASGELQPLYQAIPPQPISWSADGQQIATTVLTRYSTRYREGVYTLMTLNVETGETFSTTPTPHQSMTSLVLDANGETFTYVQGAQLWRASIDGSEEPARLTTRLTDDPSFSSNGEYAVFLSGDKLIRLSNATGEQLDLTPNLTYTRSNPAEQWVLRVGRLFDGVNDSYQEDVDVVIAGSRIQAIEPQRDRNMEVVDMSDSTVIPGLFEMHGHMGELSEPQGRLWLSFGITSVRDPGSNPYTAKQRQESWDSGNQIGPRSHITGYLADGNRVYYSIAEGLVSLDHVDRALERARLLGLDLIKTYVRLPDDWQKVVLDAAHEMGIPTSSHEIFPAVSHGMDHVEHFGGTSRRGYQPKVSGTGFIYDDVINLLAQSQMGITPTLVLGGFATIASQDDDLFATPQFNSFYSPDFPRPARPTGASRVSANGQALREMMDAGVLVVTGTDAPLIPMGIGLHAELRLYVRAGLSPFETLRAATFSSATAAGVIQDTGTLEVGKLADIVVIDGDPLNDINDADNIVMTVKNGRAFALESLLN